MVIIEKPDSGILIVKECQADKTIIDETRYRELRVTHEFNDLELTKYQLVDLELNKEQLKKLYDRLKVIFESKITNNGISKYLLGVDPYVKDYKYISYITGSFEGNIEEKK